MNFNKRIFPVLIAGTLGLATVPASAQLLGSAVSGAAGGMLDAQSGHGAGGAFGAMGSGRLGADPQLGGIRDRARQGVDNAKGQATGAVAATYSASARAARTSRQTGESTPDGGKPSPQPVLSDLAVDSSSGGHFEREAGGRRVAAQGSARHGVAKDESGIALGSQNDAGASISRVEPAEGQAASETPANDAG